MVGGVCLEEGVDDAGGVGFDGEHGVVRQFVFAVVVVGLEGLLGDEL